MELAVPIDKPAGTTRSLLPAIRDRWSPRAFADRPVPSDVLATVLEAARWTASSSNVQPWRFIIATMDDLAGHAAALACFDDGNRRWAVSAPVLMFVCAHKFRGPNRPNGHAWYDAGQAAAAMSIQATALGLRTHQAGGILRDAIRSTYAVPDEYDICTGFALGYQGEADQLPEDLANREREPRARKPLSEIAFSAKFGARWPGA